MSEVFPVSFERHGGKHLLPLQSYAFTAGQQLATLLISEFSKAAHHLPIVFVPRQAGYAAVAMLGAQPDANALVDAQGRWLAGYVPAIFRRYPFVAGRPEAAGEGEFVLCIDEDSGLLGDADGQPLYAPDGKKAPALEKALSFVTEFQRLVPSGEKFCALLQQFDLLAPLDLQVRQEEKNLKIEGLFRVDEGRLGALSNDDFLSLRAAGVLPLIYAHLFSLAKLSLLASGKAAPETQKAPAPVVPDAFKF